MTHGTLASYRRGCRCDACRGANALHQRRWRDRRRLLEVSPAPEPEDLSWQDRAACRGMNPELFFPASGPGNDTRSPASKPQIAKEVCLRCQVRGECLDYALRTRQAHGIWGGLSAHERRLLRSRKGA